ncbi:hypothetical protein CDL15_Pgr000171 [Punica granatum]|uniref:Aconitase A/isopropylmalate dehydratase small subunit swivel domain-containing protein n=1 Tax=Punica granatum TaxID=22663 RepID=A0A218Y1P9_PUNGR|nr:hypothetical protein CDL15_Pgr000171 [Punica granatum]
MLNQLTVASSTLYSWDSSSTYIHKPPYFKGMSMSSPGSYRVKDAYYLFNFRDSITTDHISQTGSIHRDNPAARYLMERGVNRIRGRILSTQWRMMRQKTCQIDISRKIGSNNPISRETVSGAKLTAFGCEKTRFWPNFVV